MAAAFFAHLIAQLDLIVLEAVQHQTETAWNIPMWNLSDIQANPLLLRVSLVIRGPHETLYPTSTPLFNETLICSIPMQMSKR